MMKWINRLFGKKVKENSLIKEERNDSGEYIIILNGSVICKCDVTETEIFDVFTQRVTTELYVSENTKVIKIALLDKVNSNIVGFRILPHSLIMCKGDSLTLTWTISTGKGFING